MTYVYIPAPPFWCDHHSPCHLRQSDAQFLLQKQGDVLPDFCRENLVLNSNAIGKHRLGPRPFKSQTSKPLCMQSPESQCQNHVFIANFRKLRFCQNKGLSLDRRYGVLNSFPTHVQTFEPKNQDFLSSTLD